MLRAYWMFSFRRILIHVYSFSFSFYKWKYKTGLVLFALSFRQCLSFPFLTIVKSTAVSHAYFKWKTSVFHLSCLPPGDAFPWTVSLSQFSVYTLLGQQKSLSLLEPMGCTSTLAVTSHKLQSGSEERHSFVVCLHVDLQPIHVKCSNPQVSKTDSNLTK